MRRIALVLILSMGCAARLLAQTPLERLEERVKDALDPRNDPRTSLADPGYLGLVVDDREEHGLGVRIMELSIGGPADKSGLKVGDLVTTIDNMPVLTMLEFARVVEGSAPGTKHKFTLIRGNRPERLEVTVGQRPIPRAREAASNKSTATDTRPGLLGIRMDVVTPEVQRMLNLPSSRGALVVGVADNSPAERAGIPTDAVIVAIDGHRIDTPSDLAQRVTDAGPGKVINMAYFSRGVLLERKVTLAGTSAAPSTAVPSPAAASQLGGGQQRLIITPGNEFSNAQEERIRILESRIQELERRIGEMQRLMQAGNPPAVAPMPMEPMPETNEEAFTDSVRPAGDIPTPSP